MTRVIMKNELDTLYVHKCTTANNNNNNNNNNTFCHVTCVVLMLNICKDYATKTCKCVSQTRQTHRTTDWTLSK